MATANATSELCSASTDNRLDFMPHQSFLPFEWRTLGQIFARKADGKPMPSTDAQLSGRCRFVVRQGYDPLDQSSTGRVLEGDGDLGIALRSKGLAVSLTTSNLALRAGLDDPLAVVGVAAAGAAPSLKATIAKEFAEDSFIAASYDLKLKKPEFSLCWTGETFTEKATLCLQADPIFRTLRVGAAVSFPGSEWRNTVYDEERDVIEEPADDGARHRLWVRHEARHRDLMHRTALGATLDLGRLVNFACDFIDYRVEPRFPPLFWAIPGSQLLYNLLVPAEDENQVRHHIKGWDLDTSFEFGRRGPRVALCKSLRHATLSASWDMHDKEAGLEYAGKGLRLGAKLARMEGLGFKRPSLYLHVEPLSLL